MSVPENNDEHKIAAVIVDNSETKGDTGRFKNKTSTSFLDGNMLAHDVHPTGTIPKSTKMISSHIETSAKVKNDLSATFEALRLSPNSSDENVSNSDRIRAKDSLETLTCKEKTAPDIISSKSTSCTTSKDKCFITESPHSESLIGNAKSTCSSSVSKVLAWDPWDKLGRKNKKENKRRKAEKTNESIRSVSPGKEKDTNRKDYKSGDEVRQQLCENPQADGYEEYAYQPYQKNIRSVEFTNKVMVVYINKEDKVVGEASEPLKKELEQQIRNKEMRRGHMPDVTFARRSSMSEWFNKK